MQWRPQSSGAYQQRGSSSHAPQQHVLQQGRCSPAAPALRASSGRRLFHRELQLGSDANGVSARPVVIPAGVGVKHAPLAGPAPVSSLVLLTEAPSSSLTDMLEATDACGSPAATPEQQRRLAMQSVAAYELGWRYFHGVGGLEQNFAASVHWLQAAASAEHAGARCALRFRSARLARARDAQPCLAYWACACYFSADDTFSDQPVCPPADLLAKCLFEGLAVSVDEQMGFALLVDAAQQVPWPAHSYSGDGNTRVPTAAAPRAAHKQHSE